MNDEENKGMALEDECELEFSSCYTYSSESTMECGFYNLFYFITASYQISQLSLQDFCRL